MLRQNQRALNKATRDLDKERQKLEQQEKKIIADIKKMAKQGQMVRLSAMNPVQMGYKGMSITIATCPNPNEFCHYICCYCRMPSK